MTRPRPPRLVAAATVAVLVAALALVVLQLTGGEDERDDATAFAIPRAEAIALALARMPAGARSVALVETDLSRGAGARAKTLAERFPGIRLGLAQELGIPLQDLAALAGHPAAVDVERRTVAVVVADPPAVVGRLRASGRPARARGRVVVTGEDPGAVDAAAARPDGLTRAAFDRQLAGVDRRGAVAVATLALPLARRTAVAVVPGRDEVVVRARLDVPDPPLARGAQPPAPRPTRGAPLTLAVRDAATALRRLRALLPNAELDELDQTLQRFAGLDLQREVLDRLTGTTTVTSRDGRTFRARGELSDPDAAADALDGLSRAGRLGQLADLLGVDTGGYAVGDGLDGTRRITRDGRLLVTIGVVDGVLVATNDPRARPRDVARGRPLGRLLPAAGALHAHVDEELLTSQLIGRLGLPRLASIVLAPLGDARVTARADPRGIDVRATVGVRADGG